MTLLETIYGSVGLQLTGLSFIFVILPAFLLVYYAVPARLRPLALLALSLAYYLLAEPGSLLLMVGIVFFNYVVLRIMEYYDGDPTARRICAGVSVVTGILVMAYCGATVRILEQPQVLGLHVYTLSAMGAVLSAYHRKGGCGRSLVHFGAYCCFFPRLYAGPLLSPEQFTAQLGDVHLKVSAVLAGLGRFVEGAFKTAVIGGSLFSLYRELRALGPAEATALSAWCTLFCAAFALYFMLSGLCDMAIGLGRAFGIRLPENFYYPFQSRSMEDFFDRFNITVHDFLKDTVYTGLGGARGGPVPHCLNLLVVGMLAGLWFGLRINYLVWGAYLMLFVILERYLYPRLLEKIPVLFRRAGTLCLVLAGFTIFLGDSPGDSLALARTMLDFGNLFNARVLYLLSSNWLLLVLSCVLATNGVNLAATKFRRAAPAVSAVVLGALDLAIFVLLVALSL